jgi:hypothetical protein
MIKNSAHFGTKDNTKAQSAISWWLTKKWNRLSVISAVQCAKTPCDTSGAQHNSKRTHLQAEEGDYVQEECRRFREQEAQHHH